MFGEVDRTVVDWIQQVASEVEVSLRSPAAADESSRRTPDLPASGVVHAYLIRLAPKPPSQQDHRTALRVTLHYLITTRAADPIIAHNALGELLFAAMEHSTFDLGVDPLPPETWSALGIHPQPSFILEVPFQTEKRRAAAPRVRESIVHHATMVSLAGRVIGPGNTPIAQAAVELPALGQTTHTDHRGRFSFGGVPADPQLRRLIVRARGAELNVKGLPPAADGRPLVIRLENLEVS